MSAPTGAQAAADLAGTRCAPVLGKHMPGCPHIDWSKPLRVLSVLEDAHGPARGVVTIHQDPPVRIVPVPVHAPMLVGRWRS